MARSVSPIFPLIALPFVLMSTTGCQEHRRLEAETAAAREEYQDLRPKLQKLSDEVAHYSKLRTEALNARSTLGYGTFTPSATKELEDEIAALQAEKSRLEKDLKAIEEEHREYKKANS